MGMYFSKALSTWCGDGSIDQDSKINDAILDFNHDGKVDWKDVSDFFNYLITPEELNILKKKLLPLVDLITLPLPKGVTIIIKMAIEILIKGLNFSESDNSQQRTNAINNLPDEAIKAVITGLTEAYNNEMPQLVEDFIHNNPTDVQTAVENHLLNDPAFEKEIIEKLNISNAKAQISKKISKP